MDYVMFSIPEYSGHTEKSTSDGGVPILDHWHVLVMNDGG
jgi:hypothetical protein